MINATEYKVGQVLNVASARLDVSQTKPPSHYTEATLMQDMLSAHKFAKSPEEREMLKQVGGIGTARTRGGIIEASVKRGYFSRNKRGKTIEIQIAEAGDNVLRGLPDVTKDVAMTAKWERALGMVASGEAQPEHLQAKIKEILQGLVPQLLSSAK